MDARGAGALSGRGTLSGFAPAAIGAPARRAAIAALALLGFATFPAPGGAAAIAWTADTLTVFDGTSRDVSFGWLSVPEDWDRPGGRRIRLGVLRYPSRNDSPGPPIVYLSGGPGIPATVTARVPSYDRLFQALRATGDVILLDPRGCGVSEPSLLCVPHDPLPADAFATTASLRSALRSAFEGCASDRRRAGVALEAFHARSIARDVLALRRALEAPAIRLLAYSHGSEVAMEIMRRDEAAVDRAVLVGVRGPEHGLRFPGVLEVQLRRLALMVVAHPDYAATWSDPVGLVRALADSLDAAPITVTIEDRRSGRPKDLTVGGVGVRLVVQGDVVDPAGFATLPAALATLASGDPALFAAKIGAYYNAFSTSLNLLPVLVECATGAEPDRWMRMEREARTSVVGGTANLFHDRELCAAVGAADLGTGFRTPVYSTVRSLFLSGVLDATTPLFQAEEVRWRFPRATHLAVGNGWHELLPVPEVQEVVAGFLAGDDVSGRRMVVPPPRILSVDEAREVLVPR